MMTDVATMDAPATLLLASEEPWVRESGTGLWFSQDTPYEVWEAITMRLIAQDKRIRWAIADAINFGERRYGEMYAQAIEVTGLAESTLATIAWVGRQIESSRRREDVDFELHRVVAPLEPDDQDRLLDEAVAEGWNRHRLREAVKVTRAESERAERMVGAPSCAADQPWHPTVGDLIPEALEALREGQRDADDAEAYAEGFLDALVWAGEANCFLPGHWHGE